MKNLFLLLLVCSLSLQAGFRVSKTVYTPDRIAEATEEATREKQPLTFILSDQHTTCPLCVNASEEALSELKRFSTVVFVQIGTPTEKLSPMVRSAINSREAGDFIPRAVLTTPDSSNVLALMRYEEIKEGKVFRDTRKAVEGMMTGKTPIPAQKEEIVWILKGKTGGYRGSFARLDGEKLVLKVGGNKREASFDLALFDEGSQAMARTLAKQAEPAVAATPPPTAAASTAFETWTSSDGRSLQARFVSLEGELLTVVSPQGQTFRIPLSQLSPASQTRSRELAR